MVLSWGQALPSVHTHLIHFRDERRHLAWDFKPSNSILTTAEANGCEGTGRFVAQDFQGHRVLEVRVE